VQELMTKAQPQGSELLYQGLVYTSLSIQAKSRLQSHFRSLDHWRLFLACSEPSCSGLICINSLKLTAILV
jgi:hypothetical protein